MITLLCFFLQLPPPTDLGHREYFVRERASAAWDTPVTAAALYLHWPPKSLETAVRRARIVGKWRQRFLDAVSVGALDAFADRPELILESPEWFCSLIDERRLFWYPDSAVWAKIPTAHPKWRVEDDYVFVARHAGQMWSRRRSMSE